MIYAHKCSNEKCNLQIDLEKGMNEEFTNTQLECPECKGLLKRDYGAESSSKTTIIPEHMTGIYQTNRKSNFKYDKSPSGKRHFW